MCQGLICVEIIQGIFDFGQLFRTNMGIYFSGCYAGVSQDLLNVPKIYTLLQEVGSKAVSQGMWCGMFVNLGLFQGIPEYICNTCSTVLSPTLSFKQPVFWFAEFVVVP